MILSTVGSVEGSSTREQKTTYHRFVKTTPKPNATKNRSGELSLALPLLLALLEGDGFWLGDDMKKSFYCWFLEKESWFRLEQPIEPVVGGRVTGWW